MAVSKELMKQSNTNILLRISSFRNFLLTRLCLTLGFQMQAVIVGWELFKITKDPFSLGLIGLAEAIPAIGIALYAGHIADIYNRKSIMRIAILVLLVSSFGLNLALNKALGASVSFWVFGFIFIGGIARGFYGPASFSLISQLVPRDMLARASTLNSTTWQFAAVVGPAFGGFAYAYIGLKGSFPILSALMFLSFLAVNFIKASKPVQLVQTEPILIRLKEGIGFVFNNKIILSALSLDLFSVLFGGATALLPIFADEILKTGPEGLGFLRAAPSLGAVLTMIYLSFRKPIHKAGEVLLKAVAAFGLSMLFFGLSESFWLSLVLLFLSGVFDSFSVVIRSNILQLYTPDHMRGRVSSVNTIFIGSSNEIGAFESGLAAKLLGTAQSVVFGACMTLGVVGLTWWKAPSLKALKFEDSQD
jgi:MFS family permease